MYKVLEEVCGSSVELLVGAQVITRERGFILDAQESLEKMELEEDRKEEALNDALKALIREEIGERTQILGRMGFWRRCWKLVMKWLKESRQVS